MTNELQSIAYNMPIIDQKKRRREKQISRDCICCRLFAEELFFQVSASDNLQGEISHGPVSSKCRTPAMQKKLRTWFELGWPGLKPTLGLHRVCTGVQDNSTIRQMRLTQDPCKVDQ